MKKRPILLRILNSSTEQIVALVKMAINVMHTDQRIRTEEWGLIKLTADLLEIAFEQASEKKRAGWKEKLQAALAVIKNEKYNEVFIIENLLTKFQQPAEQQAVLLLMFKIISADRHIDEREINYIIKEIADPWNWSLHDLLELVESSEHEVLVAEEVKSALIEYIRLYH